MPLEARLVAISYMQHNVSARSENPQISKRPGRRGGQCLFKSRHPCMKESGRGVGSRFRSRRMPTVACSTEARCCPGYFYSTTPRHPSRRHFSSDFHRPYIQSFYSRFPTALYCSPGFCVLLRLLHVYRDISFFASAYHFFQASAQPPLTKINTIKVTDPATAKLCISVTHCLPLPPWSAS